MFKRLILEDSSTLYVLTAFFTALTIFVTIAWRAVRMPRPQVERFAQLPFARESNESRHDSRA